MSRNVLESIIPELAVRDLKTSIAFYQTLGFKKNYERIEDKFVFFSLGKAQLMLQEITPHEKWQVTKELTYPYGSGINFQIEVKNCRYFATTINRSWLSHCLSNGRKLVSSGTEMVRQ